MQVKLCPTCKRPFLAEKDFCPHCPPPYAWDQESWANLGCLLMMTVVPLFLMIMFWLFFFFGFLLR